MAIPLGFEHPAARYASKKKDVNREEKRRK